MVAEGNNIVRNKFQSKYVSKLILDVIFNIKKQQIWNFYYIYEDIISYPNLYYLFFPQTFYTFTCE